MKLAKQKLKQIILEELQEVLDENRDLDDFNRRWQGLVARVKKLFMHGGADETALGKLSDLVTTLEQPTLSEDSKDPKGACSEHKPGSFAYRECMDWEYGESYAGGEMPRRIKERVFPQRPSHREATPEELAALADLEEKPDDEGRMSKAALRRASDDAELINSMIREQEQLPAWVQEQISLAAENLQSVKQYMQSLRIYEQKEKVSLIP